MQEEIVKLSTIALKRGNPLVSAILMTLAGAIAAGKVEELAEICRQYSEQEVERLKHNNN